MNPYAARVPICLILMFFQASSLLSSPTPMNCTDSSRLCTSFLAFKPSKGQNLTVIQSMFDVLSPDITAEGGGSDYVFVRKNCSCDPQSKVYLTNTTYTMRSNEGSLYQTVVDAYEGMAVLPNSTRRARAGVVVNLKLICGCSNGLWNYLMSYVLEDGDSVASLASRFGVSMGNIESVNGISDPDNVTVGQLYYIPLNTAPGEAYSLDNDIPPAPAPSPLAELIPDTDHDSAVSYRWIIGGVGIGLALIVLIGAVCICVWSSNCLFKKQESRGKHSDSMISHKFQILQRTSFCCGSGRYICGKSRDQKPEESSERRINIPKALGTDVLEIEKPLTFAYEEILAATDGFSDSSLLGHGNYGSVYYGVLHNQEVAIKKMTATKSQEFMVELKVLCKVHHANLVRGVSSQTCYLDLSIVVTNLRSCLTMCWLHLSR
uniref:LysM domain receptor-like kinase 3 n=1 Tax=Kalanchoe fedtschenkoi TaxID=63787 RepID=A0A7N0ZWE1_KALFE